jgi:hypothetical protein
MRIRCQRSICAIAIACSIAFATTPNHRAQAAATGPVEGMAVVAGAILWAGVLVAVALGKAIVDSASRSTVKEPGTSPAAFGRASGRQFTTTANVHSWNCRAASQSEATKAIGPAPGTFAGSIERGAGPVTPG